MMHWGRAIRLLRNIRRQTQTELARAAGINENYLSIIERDSGRVPSSRVVARIATALDVPQSLIADLADVAALTADAGERRTVVARHLLAIYLEDITE